MIEVVHLVGREGDLHGTRLREALLGEPGVRAYELKMNPAGGARTVPNMAWRLRRTNAIIHAWDERALLAAALARPPGILFSPSTAPDPRAPWWLLPLLQLRQAHVVVSCESDRPIVETAGFDAERCHVIPPGIKLPRLEVATQLRQKLGLGPEDRVILAIGESTRAADHERAVWAASILHVLDPRHKLLLWGRGDRTGAAAELGQKLAQPKLVITADLSSASYEERLSVGDVGLLTASGPVAPLPVLLTVAAGVPVVATEGETARKYLRDAAAIISTPPRIIAQQLLRLLENPGDRRKIAEKGKLHVTNHFPIDPFLEGYRSLYSRVGVAAAASS